MHSIVYCESEERSWRRSQILSLDTQGHAPWKRFALFSSVQKKREKKGFVPCCNQLLAWPASYGTDYRSISHCVYLGVLHPAVLCSALGFAFLNGRKCPLLHHMWNCMGTLGGTWGRQEKIPIKARALWVDRGWWEIGSCYTTLWDWGLRLPWQWDGPSPSLLYSPA